MIRTRELSVHALGLAFCAGALLLLAWVLPLGIYSCPVRATLGVPCLTCGCSHAFHYFVRARFVESLQSSPLGFVLALLCFAHLVWTLLRLCGLPFAPRAFAVTRPMRFCAVLLVTLNWAFVALS